MSSSSSPNQPKSFPVWLILLLVFVPPLVIWINPLHSIIQIPWFASLFYEVGLFFWSLVTGVWRQLWNNWEKLIADWIDRLLRGMVFKYKNSYCKQLREEYRFVHLKSLIEHGTHGLELKDVFIPPKLAFSTSQEASANPLKLPKVLRSGKYTLWDYLASEVSANLHLVVLGAPGSGKSTLLQELVLTLVDRETRRRKPEIPYTLPFLLPLQTFSNKLKDNSSYSLVDVVQQQVKALKRTIPPEWVEDQLIKGQHLILLDGLDEIADPESRKQMADWVQRQMGIYGNNRFVVTSRPHGYDSNPLDGVIVLEVQGFTQTQIEDFINKWYLATEFNRRQRKDEGVRIRAQKDAHDLLQRLRGTPALLELACNPLLLTMMATIHYYRGTLPGSRGDLYDEMCKVFLERRTRLVFPSGQKQRILQTLANYMMKQEIKEIEPDKAQSVIKEPLAYVSIQITPETFLETVEKDGIWIEGEEPGKYRFTHKTFQEYLTAMYVRENKDEEVQTLIDHIGSSWWHETIFLYCTKADATPIMEACLKGSRLSADTMELALDLELYEKQVVARLDVREQFTRALSQALESGDPEWRQQVAETLLTRRLRHLSRMLSLNDEMFVVDTSLVSCAEYQLFLDERQVHGLDHCPDHWTDYHFPAGQGLAPILGVRPHDAIAFCNWLTERDSSGTLNYRLPRLGESGRKEENVDSVGREPIGAGYWINDDTGCTYEGNQLPSGRTIYDRLNSSFREDSERARYYHKCAQENPDRFNSPMDRAYDQSIMLADSLIEARKRDSELFRTLQSIHNLTHTHERALQNELQEAKQRVHVLEDELQEVRRGILFLKNKGKQEVKRERTTKLRRIQQEINAIRADLYKARENAKELQDRQKEAEQRAETVRTRLKHANKRLFLKNKDLVRDLQEELKNAQDIVESSENQLAEVRQRESELENQFTQAQQRESELDEQLSQAQQRESKLKEHFNLFSNHASIIDSILRHSSAFGQTRDLEAFSKAFDRNSGLNLDRILNIVKEDAFKVALEDAPAQISELALAYAQDLAQALTTIHISVNEYTQTEVDAITLALTQANELVDDLSYGYTSTYVRNLANILMSRLERIVKYRSVVRRDSDLRWYIRYFARVLAGHLLYWGWNEHFFHPEQPLQGAQKSDINSDAIGTYLDIYITFLILEERIKGESLANEGILLVMEQ